MNTIEISMIKDLKESLKEHSNIRGNLARELLISQALENKDAILTEIRGIAE